MGAGLLGCSTALELARRGVAVTLVEQATAPMRGASLVNEGKVHLGFVYGHDATRSTAEVMLDGAVTFAPILRELVGERFDEVPTARPFTYLIAEDTMVSPGELLVHYEHVAERLDALLAADDGLDYLGTRQPAPLRVLEPGELAELVPSGRAVLAVETPERSISTWGLASVVVRAVATQPRIELRTGTTVSSVARTPAGFEVVVRTAAGTHALAADQVVNCLWTDRLGIDATIDVAPPRAWTYRLKYRVLFAQPAMLVGRPSLTIALGPYGDVVLYDGGDVGYASWYPTCLQGWSDALVPPARWTDAVAGGDRSVDRHALAERTLEELDAWCPGLAGLVPLDVAAGVIVAWGETDIDDHASRLHRRDELGVTSHDGYHTVETGKLTTAPRMAKLAADAVSPRVEAR